MQRKLVIHTCIQQNRHSYHLTQVDLPLTLSDLEDISTIVNPLNRI